MCLCVCIRTISQRQIKLQSSKSATSSDSIFLGSKVKGQGHRIKKCLTHFFRTCLPAWVSISDERVAFLIRNKLNKKMKRAVARRAIVSVFKQILQGFELRIQC